MPKAEQELAPIDDLKVVERYFRYAIDFKEQVSCFAEEAQLTFDAITKSFDPLEKSLEIWIAKATFESMGPWELSGLDRPSTKIRLSYSVNEVTFYVHSHVKERSGGALHLVIDLPVFKLQRREALRIKVVPSQKAVVKLGPDQFFALYDISAGGIGILVSEKQKLALESQGKFPKCQLTFAGREFTVDLELKSVQKYGKIDSLFKAGLAFRHLPASVEQAIAREAYLHTHKIWGRWL